MRLHALKLILSDISPAGCTQRFINPILHKSTRLHDNVHMRGELPANTTYVRVHMLARAKCTVGVIPDIIPRSHKLEVGRDDFHEEGFPFARYGNNDRVAYVSATKPVEPRGEFGREESQAVTLGDAAAQPKGLSAAKAHERKAAARAGSE